MNLLENKGIRGFLFFLIGVLMILVLSISGSKVVNSNPSTKRDLHETKKVIDTNHYPAIDPRDLYKTDNY